MIKGTKGKRNLATRLAREAKDDCLARRLKAIGRLVDQIYDGQIEQYGLTGGQFSLLSIILLLPDPSPVKISHYLHLEKSTLSRNLRVMERDGLIRSTKEGRGIFLEITEKGCEVYCRGIEGWRRAQALLTKKLRSKGVKSVHDLANGLLNL